MKDLLLCSQDSLLVKSIYGPLRDDGYRVETVEHHSDAVRSVLHSHYSAVVVDSKDIGLNVTETARIIKNIQKETVIVLIGETDLFTESLVDDLYIIDRPIDLDQLKGLLRRIFHNQNCHNSKGGIYDAKRDYSNCF